VKTRKKADLPRKTCPVCQRPFAWRKKWAKDWPQVVYCSDRCKRGARTAPTGESRTGQSKI
jgi:hypothetical protein